MIENIVLPIPGRRHTLHLSDYSGVHQVTNPGKSGGNHLLSPHCETMTLFFANPQRHGHQRPPSAPTNSFGRGFCIFAAQISIALLAIATWTSCVDQGKFDAYANE